MRRLHRATQGLAVLAGVLCIFAFASCGSSADIDSSASESAPSEVPEAAVDEPASSASGASVATVFAQWMRSVRSGKTSRACASMMPRARSGFSVNYMGLPEYKAGRSCKSTIRRTRSLPTPIRPGRGLSRQEVEFLVGPDGRIKECPGKVGGIAWAPANVNYHHVGCLVDGRWYVSSELWHINGKDD